MADGACRMPDVATLSFAGAARRVGTRKEKPFMSHKQRSQEGSGTVRVLGREMRPFHIDAVTAGGIAPPASACVS